MVRIIAAGWLAFVVILSASKSLGYGKWAWGSIEHFLGGNLQMHFVMAFILSALAHLASSGFWQRGWLLILLIIGCALDESVQFFLPLRNFDPLDFLVTCIGLLLAALPFMVAQWRILKKSCTPKR
ncbi:VanZ family protein [Endozoicomonas sp. ALC020]|uniref:VanZ family protein n=1 Tax=Endozoicomonas sp. ALC020 TaxID=3403077 RepID=UPI003BAE49B6